MWESKSELTLGTGWAMMSGTPEHPWLCLVLDLRSPLLHDSQRCDDATGISSCVPKDLLQDLQGTGFPPCFSFGCGGRPFDDSSQRLDSLAQTHILEI